MKNVGVQFKKNFIRSSSAGYLHLTLLPTEKCNFRCTYCYEDFKLGKMSKDTVEGIKNLLSKAAPTLKNLKIDWFGGEPTLNPKAIIEISSHIRKLQAKYHFVYYSHMTTNGYLLNSELFSRFVDLGIKDYQISLDGDEESHNTTRVQISGKGSFDVIWANLLSFRQCTSDFVVKLRLHITQHNTESMWRLCQMIKAEFGDDHRFVIRIEDIKNLGDGVETSDAQAHIADNVQQRMADIKALMSGAINQEFSNAGKSEDEMQENPYICYASMPRQLMIRSNGTIAKCTVMLNDDRNNLGKISRSGDYELDGDKLELWTRGFISLDKKAIGCPAATLPKLPVSNKFNNDIDIVEVA